VHDSASLRLLCPARYRFAVFRLMTTLGRSISQGRLRKGAKQHQRKWRLGGKLIMMRRGLPPPPKFGGPPVTNIRNTSSPHWRVWQKPEHRCLVPFDSFAEYAQEPNPETKKKDVV
jgi:hypothetical protein